MFFYFLTSFIKCSFDAVEEMFRVLEDKNTPITRDSELHKYFSSTYIRFHCDTDNKELKILCDLASPFVPEELYKLKNLERLDLSGNRLKTLPHKLGNLENLLKLDISYNLLKSIPISICKLQNLKFLKLCYNHISKIPENMVLLTKLQTLLLSSNFIDTLPSNFKECESIKTLNLSRNKKLCRFTSVNPHIGQEKILFSKFPDELEHLDLSNTRLYFIPETFDCQNLLSLDLSNNSLKILDDAFKNLKRIKILNLDHNNIDKFPAKLYRLQSLENLSICQNIITKVTFKNQSCINLKILKLNENPLRKLIMHTSSLCKLSTLSLKNTLLNKFVIKTISIMQYINKLRKSKQVNVLKIKKINVCFESLEYIGDLFDLQELTELCITCVSKETWSSHDKLLRKLSNLQNLIILSIEDCGLKIVPPAILKLKNLKIVNLSDNLITEVPSYIKDLSVKKLLMERNIISIIAVELFHNPHMEYIGLQDNRIMNLPKNLSKKNNFNGIVNISRNQIELFGNVCRRGVFDIPYSMVENIFLEPMQLAVSPQELTMGVNNLIAKSKHVWNQGGIFRIKLQEIKQHILGWDGIVSIFDMLKDKISDINLQDSTLTYLKKVYQIGEHPKNISIMYGESERNTLKNYIEEILTLLLIFLEKDDITIIENCFILLQEAHNVCFDGQLEHLIEIHKSLTDKDLKCLKTTICNILAKYKYEGLRLITTSNSYSENVHFLSLWRNFFSEIFGFEEIPNLYSVPNPNPLLSSRAYIMIQMFKHLDVGKIVQKLKNEINENSMLMVEATGFLFQLFEENLEKLQTMVTYDGELEDLLITGITTQGVEAILLEYNLIRKNSK